MKSKFVSKILSQATVFLLATVCLFAPSSSWAVTPPVIRSTDYNGAYSNIVYYAVAPWMNTNTPLMTVEAWVYCRSLSGNQAFVARHYTTNLYFGASGNRLRFYRSGGTSVDSDGTLALRRWTHVAATYDGATARFYINGALAGTKALANAGNNSTNRLSLGGEHDLLGLGDGFAGGYAFDGQLDEVRLWSVVRPQSAIAAGMNSEIRAGAGLLATFGNGGDVNELGSAGGSTDGIAVRLRRSGFGILPATLCIPRTTASLVVDGTIDMLNEYRGAETIVLRSTFAGVTRDQPAYLIVSSNSSNFHLFVGVPDLAQAGAPRAPTVQVMADANTNDGPNPGLGDWECAVAQDSLQGGSIYGVNPPFFNTPQWLSWGQSALNWQGATAAPFEFIQNYEFRIHGRNLNYFTNAVGLLARYSDFTATAEQLVAPLGGIPRQPSTYAIANWCGVADTDLSRVSIFGEVSNIITHANETGWTVTLRSGLSPLGGQIIRSIPLSAAGTFSFDADVPRELPFHVILEPQVGYTFLPPEFFGPGTGRDPSAITANYTLTYSPCGSAFCLQRSVRFVVQPPPGPVAITSVSPNNVPATVLLRSSPRKTTPVAALVIQGANLHSGVNVFFKGSGCLVDPPDFCTSDWVKANIISNAFDRSTLIVEVPELSGVAGFQRSFQIVVEDPHYGAAGGHRWNYGPNVLVSPPPYAQLYGFEFPNTDDGPSLQEFEANFGDNIFVDLPFTDTAIPGLRDPYYYGFFLPVYLIWMDTAHGSCSGFASTSRLFANGVIPNAAFDRADNGGGVHGVVYPDGYVGLPPCDDRLPGFLCPPKPAAWTGFDLFHPFQPINVWARITSLQGAQTSAEFLNTWLGQLHRPIALGPRRGMSVGDPNLTLLRVRSDIRETLIVLGGRDFQNLHTVTPVAVLDEQGLMDDLRTPTPRAGFSLIRIYDNNWPEMERFMEIDRGQNTFRYSMFDSFTADGAGLYYMPLSVFRNPRHALGPIDIAVNLSNLLRVLHTGASALGLQDAAGGQAGWSGGGLVNTFDGASPFIPPGALPGEAERFDRTMFLLPATNPPTKIHFLSGGGNILLHYALGEGDFAFGFNAPNTTADNSVYGVLIGLNKALQGMGVRVGSEIQGFSASVSSRDASHRSLVWQIDAGAGPMTPDVHLERDGFAALKIRNNSPQAFSYRVHLVGSEIQGGQGLMELSTDAMKQPGNSTITLRPVLAGGRGFVSELDTNGDGKPDFIETVPARGALRASDDSGTLTLRWRSGSASDALESTTDLAHPKWAPVKTAIATDGLDQAAKIPMPEKQEFFRLSQGISDCLLLSTQALGAKPNPWEIGGVRFEALKAEGSAQAQNLIVNRAAATGLDVAHTVRVHPQYDCDTMHLDLRQTSGSVVVEAIGPLGAVMAREVLADPGSNIQRVSLRTARSRIQYVRVISPKGPCLIASVCCERTPTP